MDNQETIEPDEIVQECCACSNTSDSHDLVTIGNGLYCDDCYSTCEGCSELIDNDDSTYSDLHSCTYCNDCYSANISSCYSCSTEISSDGDNTYRNREYCQDCFNDQFTDCVECSEVLRRDEAYYSDDGEHYCSDCFDKIDNVLSFADYTTKEVDKILSYSCKPKVDFHSTQRDKDDNIFMGIELEMNFDESDFSEINDLTRKYIRNKYIWKEDGSIGEGGELVLTAMTYQHLRTINFKEYFSELKKLGVTSYEGGKCGLHVHISDNSLDNYYKHALFYSMNRALLKKFSQRSDAQLEQWCNFETPKRNQKNSTRYRAVNLLDNTLEFRIFRGTIDYKRFKCSLLFVESLNNFLKTKSIKLMESNPPRWKDFISYLQNRNQYDYLLSYLKFKDLLN